MRNLDEQLFWLGGTALFIIIFSGALAYSLTHNIYVGYSVSGVVLLLHVLIFLSSGRDNPK